ncbi:MAG: MATE family efflux transporter [Gammaproteobacteria bacterium]|nr:MAG: MATE family efflux transporter [Gammaproteobacteria bacterium]
MRTDSQAILSGPIGSVLVHMTIPMIIGIAVMILYQVINTFFVSRMGTEALAAISFTFPVVHTMTNFGVGFGIGVSVILAKSIGGGDLGRARLVTTYTIWLVLALGVLLAALGIATVNPLFQRLGASADTLVLIHEYMDVWYLGSALMMFQIISNGILRATGDTRLPSIVMVISAVLNAVLDPLLIFGPGPLPALGIRGAAIATLIAWTFASASSLWIMLKREGLLDFSLPDPRKMLKYWRELTLMSLPISGANMLIPIASMIMTGFVARYGEHAVAGFGVGSRIEAVAMIVCIALTSALSPYMAQNLGAGQYPRARNALNLSLRFALLFEFGLYPILALAAPWLTLIFSRDPQVQQVAMQFLWIMPIGFAFYGMVIIINTGFNAAHQSHKTLIASLVRLFLCYVPAAWLGGMMFDIPGLFVGAVAGNGLGAWIAWQMLLGTWRGLEDGEIEKAVA